MKIAKVGLLFLFLVSFAGHAQEILNLYVDAVPNSKPSEKKEVTAGFITGVTKPTLEMYLPEKSKATGVAVIIIPGGSYRGLAYQGEGVKTAKEFMNQGVAAFVLKYRLPDDEIMIDKKIGPLQDAQQSVKFVRENAAKWGINPNKVGIMGFSAGGHLASTAATHFKTAVIENKSNTNLRPDFLILVYPVISMQDSLTHKDSRNNLLGKTPSKELIAQFSNELQVNETTPPTYITHASDDKLVDVDNSIAFYESLRHNKVPVEMHLYPKGDHGFVVRQKTEEWMLPLFQWMKASSWIGSPN